MSTSTVPFGTPLAQAAELLGKDSIYHWQYKVPGGVGGLPVVLLPKGKDGRRIRCTGDDGTTIDQALAGRASNCDELLWQGLHYSALNHFSKISTVGESVVRTWLPRPQRHAGLTLKKFFDNRFAPEKLAHTKPATQHCYRNAINRLAACLDRAPIIADLSDETLTGFEKWLVKSGYAQSRQASISSRIAAIRRYAELAGFMPKKQNGCPYLPGNRPIKAFKLKRTQGPAKWFGLTEDARLIAQAIDAELAKAANPNLIQINDAARKLGCSDHHLRARTRLPDTNPDYLWSTRLPARQPDGGIVEKLFVRTEDLAILGPWFYWISGDERRATIKGAAEYCAVPEQTVKTWLRRCPPLHGPLKAASRNFPHPKHEGKEEELLTVLLDDLDLILERHAKAAGLPGRWPKYPATAPAATNGHNGAPEATARRGRPEDPERDAAIAEAREGKTNKQVGQQFDVDKSAVQKACGRHKRRLAIRDEAPDLFESMFACRLTLAQAERTLETRRRE